MRLTREAGLNLFSVGFFRSDQLERVVVNAAVGVFAAVEVDLFPDVEGPLSTLISSRSSPPRPLTSMRWIVDS